MTIYNELVYEAYAKFKLLLEKNKAINYYAGEPIVDIHDFD